MILRRVILSMELLREQHSKIFLMIGYAQCAELIRVCSSVVLITTTNIDSLFEENAPFIINKCEGATCLQGFLNAKNIEYWSDKKVIGLFDFDEERE